MQMTEGQPAGRPSPGPSIGVVQVGLGHIGRAIVRRLAVLDGVHVVAAVDPAPELQGRDAGEVAGTRPLGVKVVPELRQEDARGASVALHSTLSHLEQVLPQLVGLVESGLHVVSTCEELAWPWFHHPEAARALDRAARHAGVTVLGTGVNPGFVMDLLPLLLTGVCTRVDRVVARRVVDASRRREPLQRKIGSGTSPEQFRRLVQESRMGHVGLPESVALVAAGLGWRLDRIEQQVEPIVAHEPIVTEHVHVQPGQVQGLFQTAAGYQDGRERVRLELWMALRPQHLAPSPVESASFDEVRVEGEPPVHVVIPEGISGDTATVAAVTNAIPAVMEAPPGLLSVRDLPPVRWWGGRLVVA